MAYPNTWSSSERKKEWNKEMFYTYNGKILTDELSKAKIGYPGGINDYDTFVYVYPRFTHYGRYDKGTLAYTIKTNVRIYDVKKQTVYESKQIDEKRPAQKFSYFGSAPEVHFENMDTNKAVKYLKKLN